MSTLDNTAFEIARADETRQILFVNKLTEKTRAGRVVWKRGGRVAVAVLPVDLLATFVLGAGGEWQLLVVRNLAEKTEILCVEPVGALIAILGTDKPTPLQLAVNHLFEAVRPFAGDDLDKAISALDKL